MIKTILTLLLVVGAYFGFRSCDIAIDRHNSEKYRIASVVTDVDTVKHIETVNQFKSTVTELYFKTSNNLYCEMNHLQQVLCQAKTRKGTFTAFQLPDPGNSGDFEIITHNTTTSIDHISINNNPIMLADKHSVTVRENVTCGKLESKLVCYNTRFGIVFDTEKETLQSSTIPF